MYNALINVHLKGKLNTLYNERALSISSDTQILHISYGKRKYVFASVQPDLKNRVFEHLYVFKLRTKVQLTNRKRVQNRGKDIKVWKEQENSHKGNVLMWRGGKGGENRVGGKDTMG
jgi:hypothetical protein